MENSDAESCHRRCCGGDTAGEEEDCSNNGGEGAHDLAVLTPQHTNNSGSRRVARPSSSNDDAHVNLVPQTADSPTVRQLADGRVPSPTNQSARVTPEPKMNISHSGPQHYQLLTLIGHGSYGGVLIWLARHAASSRLVAVRTIDLDKCELPLSQIEHEIKMHRYLHHKNILAAIDCFASQSEIWMVLPPMAYGSCRDLLHAHFKDGLPEMAVAYILRDVLRAVNYLHMRGKIHRDIKASHILVQSDGSICLSGLRHVLSMVKNGQRLKVVHDFPDHYVHSLNWASREMLEQNLSGYDMKSDIYSIGITACELANGVVPFQDMPLTQMLLSKIEGMTPRLLDVSTLPELEEIVASKTSSDGEVDRMHPSLLPYQRVFTPLFHNFVEVCLLQEPASRPTAAVLESHGFFKQIQPKCNPPSLPELLRPLNPISVDTIPVSGDPAIDALTQKLSEAAFDVDWMF